MLKITKCPTCGSRQIRKVRRNWTETLHGQTYTVPKLQYYLCAACGEELYDPETMRRIEEHRPAPSKRRSRLTALA